MRYKRAHVVRPKVAPHLFMTVVDLDHVARLIREVAEAEILPRFRRLEDHHAWEKRSGSIVTVADEAAERRLEDGLLALAPGAVALADTRSSELIERTLRILHRRCVKKFCSL